MLAIFDGRVAKRPECMMMPHKNAVSALKDDFLVNHFTSVYPDSVVISSDAAFTFAYSLGVTSTSSLPRFHFAHKDNVFCMYQGYIEDIDIVKKHLHFSEIDDEAILMIGAFQILRQLGQRVPKIDVDEVAGNCVSVLYESPSKLVVLAGGSYWDLPIYWGIDARFNLVISNNETVVDKACGSVQPFVSGRIYACCEGRAGLEAFFVNKQPEFKVDLTDKNIPRQQSVESITKMILQADMDRSKPCAEKWEPPASNFLKVNTDAVMFHDGTIGIGVVIRNSNGDIEFAATKRKLNSLPDCDPVVQGFIEGVSVAVGFQIPRFICESVHLNLEQNKQKIGSATMKKLIRNAAKLVVGKLSEFSVSFVNSSANKAAHRLAEKAKSNTFWVKETPECIASIVASECPKIDCTIS